MKGIIEWMARNSVASNLLMVFILVSGFLAITTAVTEEVFPEIELDRISITVPYLGAAPEEVEEAVAVRIEEAIQGLARRGRSEEDSRLEDPRHKRVLMLFLTTKSAKVDWRRVEELWGTRYPELRMAGLRFCLYAVYAKMHAVFVGCFNRWV